MKLTATSLLLPQFGRVAEAATILDTLDPQTYRNEAALYPMVGKVTGRRGPETRRRVALLSGKRADLAAAPVILKDPAVLIADIKKPDGANPSGF